jgi:hypothetical protein
LRASFTELTTMQPRDDLIAESQIQKQKDLNSAWLNGTNKTEAMLSLVILEIFPFPLPFFSF